MATVKGVWMFNSTLTRPAMNFFPEVSFTSNNGSFTGMGVRQETKYYLLSYDITPIYGSTAWENEAYRVVDFGKTAQTVPDDFYAWFTDNAMTEEDIEEIRYSIYGSTLTAIADQVRRISGVEGGLTPEQMESNLMNVTVGAELPSAENFTFGTEPGGDWTEYGITAFSRNVNAYAEVKTRGYTFIANQACAVLGLRYFEVNATISANTLKLWNANGEQVRTATCAAKKVQSWGEVYFDEPLNVAVGEKYTVSMYRDKGSKSGAAVEDVTFNPRLTFVNTSSSDNDAFPNDNVSTYVVAGVDIIIGPVRAELPNDYRITHTTMNDIAEEVQRISGTETKMTVEQIQQELSEVILQEKTVTPSAEQQVIIPDSGFYGISKVTVGAVEQTESAGSMFSTTAVGILPTVYKGTAGSEFSLSFESSAVGALSE